MGSSLNKLKFGIMGDKLMSPSQTPNSGAGDFLEKIATDYYNQTDPIRQGLIGRSKQFLDGNLDVTASPMFASLKLANEQQFQRARDNALSSNAAGGGLTSALVGLEGQKAQSMTQGISALAGDELNRAMGFANPQGAMSGLGTAAQIQNQNAQFQAQQEAQMKQGMGQGIGMLAATKSSRTFKTDNEKIDTSEVLSKVCALPVEKWKYIGDDKEHIGTYAEEFSRLFGGSDKSIDTATAVGVLMASIQELVKRINYLESTRV